MMNWKQAHRSKQESRLSQTRAGFSLLEVIIVTTLMVIIAAMSLPALINVFQTQKLNKAADRVRSEMGRARVEAIRTGDVYAFFFRPGMTSYTVAPFDSAFNAAMFMPEEQVGGLDNRATDFNFEEERLPRGVTFALAEAAEDARYAQTALENQVDLSEMRPILFYPDGTSQTATIILMNEKQEQFQINLRGLTGTTSAGLITGRQ